MRREKKPCDDMGEEHSRERWQADRWMRRIDHEIRAEGGGGENTEWRSGALGSHLLVLVGEVSSELGNQKA